MSEHGRGTAGRRAADEPVAALRKTPRGRVLIRHARSTCWSPSIFVYCAVPVLLGGPLVVHAGRRSLHDARCSTSRRTRRWTNYTRGARARTSSRDALLNSTIVAGVGHAPLAGDRLASPPTRSAASSFRGRSFVLYLMLSMTIFPQIAILGALYTMITTFHLYDTARRADLQLPDLHAAVHGLGADELHARAAARPRGGGLRRRRDAAPGLLQGAAAADRPGPRHDRPARVHLGLERVPLRAVVHPDARASYTVPLAITTFVSKTGSGFEVPWGQIMAATVIVTLPLIFARAGPPAADPRRPHRRRVKGCRYRSRRSPRLAGRRSRAGSCRRRARSACRSAIACAG